VKHHRDFPLQGVKSANYRALEPSGIFTGAGEWGRLEKSPKLTAICDGRNFSSSSSFAPRELGRGRPGRSTIIIIARRVRSRVHPLRLRDRCGVTAISVILPTLLYVSNVVVSPRIDDKESSWRPVGPEKERERERLRANEPTVLRHQPARGEATRFLQTELTIFNSIDSREHRSRSASTGKKPARYFISSSVRYHREVFNLCA